ncbi:MAG: hypothetical protein P9X22_03010 [Candidatus Zapsychrus exili]|nr:hypothetical protein [Candidatus Zapsychrus exili]
MKKLLVLLVCIGLIGCASSLQFSNKISGTQSYAFSTAPKDITFNKAVSALQKLNYNLTNTDKQGGMIVGQRMITLFRYLSITVNMSETDKTKVTTVVRDSGGIDSFDVFGFFIKHQNAFYKELKAELNNIGYDLHM